MDNDLADNISKMAEDFMLLKQSSDEMYLEQDREENSKNKRNVPLQEVEHKNIQLFDSIEDEYIEKLDNLYSMNAIRRLLENNELTEIQKRRFLRYIFDGLSLRQIAELEGRSHLPIYRSINQAIRKLKKYFYLQGYPCNSK